MDAHTGCAGDTPSELVRYLAPGRRPPGEECPTSRESVDWMIGSCGPKCTRCTAALWPQALESDEGGAPHPRERLEPRVGVPGCAESSRSSSGTGYDPDVRAEQPGRSHLARSRARVCTARLSTGPAARATPFLKPLLHVGCTPPGCGSASRRRLEQIPSSGLVSEGGLEPPRPCGHQPLKLARLPIPPLRRGHRLGLEREPGRRVVLYRKHSRRQQAPSASTGSDLPREIAPRLRL